MADKSDGVPSWLFSFVDLAFLMVIAMTQLASDPSSRNLDLGEMVVPRIAERATTELPRNAAKSWQLRVHPRSEEEPTPFELMLVGDADGARSERFGEVDALRERLAALQRESPERPVLAPHESSRSQDLLDAAALIEEFWPGRRRVTVSRVLAL